MDSSKALLYGYISTHFFWMKKETFPMLIAARFTTISHFVYIFKERKKVQWIYIILKIKVGYRVYYTYMLWYVLVEETINVMCVKKSCWSWRMNKWSFARRLKRERKKINFREKRKWSCKMMISISTRVKC